MNERIKELTIKAGFPEWSNHAIEFELEQFAALLIEECVLACINEGKTFEVQSAGYYSSKLYATAIKKHFGIEEQDTESNQLHTCPYAEEIHGDYTSLCICDEEQTHQCRMDI